MRARAASACSEVCQPTIQREKASRIVASRHGALAGGDERDVGDLQPVRSVGGEIALDQVRGEVVRWSWRVNERGPARADALEAGLAHQGLDPLAADVSDLAPKGGVDVVNPPGQLGVVPSAFAGLVDAERQRW